MKNEALTNMIQCQLAPNGIQDQSVLDAFMSVDRSAFLSGVPQASAYIDQNVMDEAGELLMIRPTTLATMIQHLAGQFDRGRVAIVGAPTGYEAKLLEKLAFEPTYVSGEETLSSGAPWRAVMICGAVATLPDYFLQFLHDNGRVYSVVIADDSLTGNITVLNKKGYTDIIGQAGVPFVKALQAPELFSL